MSTTFASDSRIHVQPHEGLEILFLRDVTLSVPKPGTPRLGRRSIRPRLEARPVYLPAAPRSDRELQTTCIEALRWATTLAEEAVQVSVQNGRATLRGQVSQTAQSQTAEDIIRSIPGILSVENKIRFVG